MSSYVAAKLQDSVLQIGCPSPGCHGLLESYYCREILPLEVFERWGNILCESIVFARNASAPWHLGIECSDASEFQKLNETEREREDILLMNLAKDKKWKRVSSVQDVRGEISGLHAHEMQSSKNPFFEELVDCYMFASLVPQLENNTIGAILLSVTTAELLPPATPISVLSAGIRGYAIARSDELNLRSPLKTALDNAEALLFRHNALRRVEEVRLVPCVDIIATALGFASGVGLYYVWDSNKRKYKDDAGEWILFTTPSPSYSLCACLRCPSLSFPGIEKLEDVNDTLVKEKQAFGERLCVPTMKGGVISLDLPANLNLGEEMDWTPTLLLVPGTTEGSMDKDVQMFVSESLNRGCFPVCINPRDVLDITAGDSDDVCKAVQFISEMRPMTTIMGVGWGYGANIRGPKDLSQQLSIDRKLLDGLKDILRSNKGETVLKALQDAIPEDASEKLTTTVSELSNTVKNLKLDGVLNISQNSKSQSVDNPCGSGCRFSSEGLVDSVSVHNGTPAYSDEKEVNVNGDLTSSPESVLGNKEPIVDQYKGMRIMKLLNSSTSAYPGDSLESPHTVMNELVDERMVKGSSLAEDISGCNNEHLLIRKRIMIRLVSEKDMKAISHNLAKDLELVSNVISQAVIEDTVATWSSTGRCLNNDNSSMTCSNLRAEHIVKAVSFTDQEAQYLRRILPVGVIVGSSLAALKKYFNLISRHDSAQGEPLNNSKLKSGKMEANVKETKNGMEFHQPSATAVGASALLMQDSYAEEESSATVIKSMKNKEYKDKEPKKLGDEIAETQKNLVTSIGEKAMSVAGSYGSHEGRWVITMLTNLGQNGGMLKLVGKSSRFPPYSLTNENLCSVVVNKQACWICRHGNSFVVTRLHSTTSYTCTRMDTKSPSKAAELCCIIGLYVAVTVLIMLWGKRIRGYERPLQQYGLDFKLPEYIVADLLALVELFVAPEFGKFLLLVAQGTISATGVVLVEELLFRSWLPAEISKEFGFHLGIIVAGFTFAILQWSLNAIPGLWLLSLALAGAKERSKGSLSTPIGLRAGIVATTFVLQKGTLLTYHSKVPLWIWGTHPVQPFSGISGLALSLLLAVCLYPRQPNDGKIAARKIRE
ncbi:unnamed protein product [Rhodiola kirilowii]